MTAPTPYTGPGCCKAAYDSHGFALHDHPVTAPTPRIGPFAAQGYGCPKCGSILNAAAAGCDGEWHAGNQTTSPAPTGPEPEEELREQLDAIEQRWREESPVEQAIIVPDLGTLLAWLMADRDHWFDQHAALDDEVGRHIADVDDLTKALAGALAELVAVLPLRKAAAIWRAQFSKPTKLPRVDALIAAVDELPALPPGTPTYAQLLESHAQLLDERDDWGRTVAEMGAEIEAVRPVREAAVALREQQRRIGPALSEKFRALIAAVDQMEARPVTDAGQCHYLSTACKHAHEAGREHLHDDCATGGKRWDGSVKVPATCKWCLAPCRCLCHLKPVVAAAAVVGADESSSPQPEARRTSLIPRPVTPPHRYR